MPIIVKHSGNVGSKALGAYGGGQGKRRQQDSSQALSLAARQREGKKRRDLRKKENQQRLEEFRKRGLARKEESQAQRDFRAEQGALDREFDVEQSEVAYDRSLDRIDRNARLQDKVSLRRQMREKDLIEHKLTEEQKAGWNKIERQIDAIRGDETMTNQDKKDAIRIKRREQYGLKPFPRMREESDYPEGQGVGKTWTSEDGNFLLTRDSKGDVKKISDIDKPTQGDINDAWEAAQRMAGDDEGVINVEKAEKWFKRIMGGDEKGGAPGKQETVTPQEARGIALEIATGEAEEAGKEELDQSRAQEIEQQILAGEHPQYRVEKGNKGKQPPPEEEDDLDEFGVQGVEEF